MREQLQQRTRMNADERGFLDGSSETDIYPCLSAFPLIMASTEIQPTQGRDLRFLGKDFLDRLFESRKVALDDLPDNLPVDTEVLMHDDVSEASG